MSDLEKYKSNESKDANVQEGSKESSKNTTEDNSELLNSNLEGEKSVAEAIKGIQKLIHP